jgi:hypothetical protein
MYKKGYWRGGNWVIRTPQSARDREMIDGNTGYLDSDRRTILVDGDIDKEGMVCSVIHEVLHEVFPRATEEAVRAGERDIKHFLEIFGVDLSPLVKGE